MGSALRGSFDIAPCGRDCACRRFAGALFPGSADGKHSGAYDQRRHLICTDRRWRYEACTLYLGNCQLEIDRDAEWIAHAHLSRMAVYRSAAAFGFSFRQSCSLPEYQVLATADRIEDRL